MDGSIQGGLLMVRDAEVLCPSGGLSGRMDLWVENGILRHRDPGRPADRELDAEGLVAVPGFVEIHAHLREPGFTDSETVESGLAAAFAGGYTAVFAMANTQPPNDSPGITLSMLDAARAAGSPVRLYPVGAATVGMRGEEPSDYAAQLEAGAGAISDDGLPVTDDAVMERCMAEAAAVGIPIFDHATHGPCPGGGVVHEGEAARRRGLPGLPREEEDGLVARDISLAERTGHPVHICHISTIGGVDAVRNALERGVPVTAEATPHHLLLTDELAVGPDHKMNPPLREEADRRAVLAGLRDGTIRAVATDHAPHAPALKERGILKAPFGVIGMESAFAALYTGLVLEGDLPLAVLVERLTSGPAGIVGIPGGRLTDGARAEIALLDLPTEFTFDAADLRSRSRNCPFLGKRLRGRVAATLAGGAVHCREPERIRSRNL